MIPEIRVATWADYADVTDGRLTIVKTVDVVRRSQEIRQFFFAIQLEADAPCPGKIVSHLHHNDSQTPFGSQTLRSATPRPITRTLIWCEALPIVLDVSAKRYVVNVEYQLSPDKEDHVLLATVVLPIVD